LILNPANDTSGKAGNRASPPTLSAGLPLQMWLKMSIRSLSFYGDSSIGDGNRKSSEVDRSFGVEQATAAGDESWDLFPDKVSASFESKVRLRFTGEDSDFHDSCIDRPHTAYFSSFRRHRR
jgi:hypothetical protein